MTLPTPPVRFVALGAVVVLANAGLLVLQLAAGRLLVPFVGSSLETWTAVIGVFLAGIAAGNALGGRLADRRPSPRALAACLLAGGLAAGWMVVFPKLLAATGWHRPLPFGLRVPVLAVLECLPAGVALSLPTPLAVRLGLADVRRAGRTAGAVFALGALGSLAGNYVTGFYLLPALTVDAIVWAVAGGMVAAAGLVGLLPRSAAASRLRGGSGFDSAFRIPTSALLVVFLASAAGMALELAAARVLAPVVGVSLDTWTGVIGVMLAGTAAGNWLGGIVADRGGGRNALGLSLLLAAGAAAVALVGFFAASRFGAFDSLPLRPRVLAWTFALFFLPMLLLGTVSPQVVRLAVTDVAAAGRVAGRVYAWSAAGAVAGTFLTGYVLIAAVGVYRTVLGVAVVALIGSLLAARVWERRAALYAVSVVGGAAAGGFALLTPEVTKITRETNYFTLVVRADPDRPGVLQLQQDLLVHSRVDPADPTYLHYAHERVQLELLWLLEREWALPHVLVIGGGGYTFPRAARTLVPACRVDVAEIDPGVTAIAYSHLALDPALGIRSFHRDGRQFVAERAEAGRYHLVTLDAVNDLSVPAHLLTVECNEAVKRTLAPGGVYLVTVIDRPAVGKLWKAAVHTLRRSFAHVEVLTSSPDWNPSEQKPLVLYAADRPLDLPALRAATGTRRRPPHHAVAGPAAWFGDVATTYRPPAADVNRLLAADPPLVLTDQYAPVDRLMADVFRARKE